MPGDGGTQTDFRRLGVAHLAHQDHVRILAQTGPQHPGESQLDLVVDLYLGQAGQAVLHRVFDRDDLELGRIHFRQRRIQRGGFARAGRPGHQHQAGTAHQHFAKTAHHVLGHADRVEPAHARALVEQTHHNRLAVIGRQGGKAHVDGGVLQTHAETAVLRQALLGYVQPGHQLEPLRQRTADTLVGLGLGLQHAIDPYPDMQARLLRLYVHIRRPHLRGIFEHGLQQAHHRCALQPRVGRELAKIDRVADVLLERARQAADFFGAPVQAVQRQR